ncbi:putative aminopeptidase [Phlyctochytrium arcticum]|nr:putative aminopeptidase [Phlyctochytrium arcticum]
MLLNLIPLAAALLSIAPIASAQSNPVHPIKYSDEAATLAKTLAQGIEYKDLSRHLRALESIAKTNGNNRASATQGADDSVAYVKQLLEATGAFDVQVQRLNAGASATVTQLMIDQVPIEDVVTLSKVTKSSADGIEAELVLVGGRDALEAGCQAQDYQQSALQNKIVAVRGDGCSAAEKASFAKAAGAVGLIILSTSETDATSASFSTRAVLDLPTVAIESDDVANQLVASLETGKTVNTSLISFETKLAARYNHNVIATTKGGDPQNLIHIGAHLDSVPAGPGMNDNGSGSSGILQTALLLAPHVNTLKNQVRFSWWAAEEIGLVGSKYYVNQLPKADLKRTKVYLNFDMIASPNYYIGVYDGDGSLGSNGAPQGSLEIEALFNNYFKDNKVGFVPTAFNGRSDYGPFIAQGVPSGGLFTGASDRKTAAQAKLFGGEAGVAADKCYHRACDTFENINEAAMVINSKAIAHSVGVFAMDASFIPNRLDEGSSLMAPYADLFEGDVYVGPAEMHIPVDVEL